MSTKKLLCIEIMIFDTIRILEAGLEKCGSQEFASNKLEK
jgi:hypothetical protein